MNDSEHKNTYRKLKKIDQKFFHNYLLRDNYEKCFGKNIHNRELVS
jgi:hypothetical protein